jgi:polyisoprenoid-binding protein YceI
MDLKKTVSVSCAFFAVAILAVTSPAADTFTIDPAHSSIGFVARHMVVTNVRGAFNDFAGTILYDDKDITKSSVEVSIKTATIDTKEPKRDEHLRSPDFFDAAKYPDITFKSKRIEKTADGYVAIGDLTMRGVTKEIKVPFTIAGMVTDPYGNTRMGLSANAELNRQDYGVSWNKKLDTGGLVVGDDVKIEIEVEAVKANKAK